MIHKFCLTQVKFTQLIQRISIGSKCVLAVQVFSLPLNCVCFPRQVLMFSCIINESARLKEQSGEVGYHVEKMMDVNRRRREMRYRVGVGRV